MPALLLKLKNAFLDEYENFNLWLVVAFGLGIILYLTLPFEPIFFIGFTGIILTTIGIIATYQKSGLYFLFLFLFFIALGFARIQLETKQKQAPFLHRNYHFVDVLGQVENTEIMPSAVRVILKPLRLSKITPENRPKYIRLRINGRKETPAVGDILSLKASLMPPTLAMIEGGYPFNRKLFFEQIGATGYATSKVKIISTSPTSSVSQKIDFLRQSILKRITSLMPIEEASVLTALITGEQKLVPTQIYDDYTDAGIVHILSVSGFHMTLIVGFIFFFLRFVLSFFPFLVERFNIKKICAFCALLFGLFYLFLSGNALPAQRSFLMVAFVFIGILFDRRTLNLRSVAWAAFLILLISPAALMTASFQLSFMAVIALIAGFGYFRKFFYRLNNEPKRLKRFFTLLLFGFLLTNILAHFATAPIAIYHFHRYVNYSLLGNLCTGFLFSFVVMPLLLISTLLMPFGWDAGVLLLAGNIVKLINYLIHWIASLPFAVVYLPPLNDVGFALICFGILWICFWKKAKRTLGFVAVFLGLFSLFFYTPPDVIIHQGGRFYALKTDNGYAFSSLRKNKFQRRVWLENNGFSPKIKSTQLPKGALKVKNKIIAFDIETAPSADLAIIAQKGIIKCPAKQCLFYRELWQNGTHSIFVKDNQIIIKDVLDKMGDRPWNPLYKEADSPADTTASVPSASKD